MADVTINNLPDLNVSGTNFLVHTNGITTGKATINTLRSALSIPSQTSQLTNNSNFISGSTSSIAKAWFSFIPNSTSNRYYLPSNGASLPLTSSFNINRLIYVSQQRSQGRQRLFRATFTNPISNPCAVGSTGGNYNSWNSLQGFSCTANTVDFYMNNCCTDNGNQYNDNLISTGVTTIVVYGS